MRDGLRGAVACHAVAVVRSDWDTAGDVAQHWPAVMAAAEQRANLADPGQARALDHRDASQRDRVVGYLAREDHAAPAVPAILWVAMIAGGVLLVGYLCVFARPRTSTALQA